MLSWLCAYYEPVHALLQLSVNSSSSRHCFVLAAGWTPDRYERKSFDENPMGTTGDWARSGESACRLCLPPQLLFLRLLLH